MNKKKLTEHKHRRRSKEKIPGRELHKEKSDAAWEQAKQALAGARGSPECQIKGQVCASGRGGASVRARLQSVQGRALKRAPRLSVEQTHVSADACVADKI